MLPPAFLSPINIAAFQFMKAIASPGLNTAMSWVTDSFYVIIPVLIIYAFLRKNDNVYSLIVAGIVLYIISDVLKHVFMEPRPCSVSDLSWINQTACDPTYGFPSNHAAVLAGLPMFIWGHKIVRVLYIVWVAVVLFSRIYLGQHYLTDVLAGIVISLVVSYIIWLLRAQLSRIGNLVLGRIGILRLRGMILRIFTRV
ncbi:MAG: phosphatase PAP2 family protein [Candidatus Micrarchaeota archaeon]|nr:phosphatase PAP2 family protein [Candidatus Micrarchaeota archaeon]